MPLTIPTLDNRKYQDLLDEALARIPVHTPEWTNFNQSDPGVTLIQVFAFLTETLLYRSNQIPERNRRKFLSLLGIPLQAASSARGIVTFANDRGPLRAITLNDGLEVRAGQVPFRTESGLDVLPIEAQAFYKRQRENPPQQLIDYYAQLYASYLGQPPDTSQLRLYDTLPLPPRATIGVDLGQRATDHSLWIALLVRTADKPHDEKVQEARKEIGGKTISLGIVPYVDTPARRLPPSGRGSSAPASLLQYQIPVGGTLSGTSSMRVPQYRTLATSESPAEPSVVQITLPEASQLTLWDNLDPLEAGVGDFPPTLEDTTLNERLITWLRISAPPGGQLKLLWAGINTVLVTQRAHVANELLPSGTGEPDQVAVLAKTPVIPDSVRLIVTPPAGQPDQWQEVEDLTCAGPEVPVPDLRQAPGTLPLKNNRVNVFTVNRESGEVHFGDGTRGRRPPRGATLRASYDYGVGRAGNVGPDSINSGPALPAGLKVANPVRTWGGAETETVSEGEKQIACYLQHRDRLVNANDFQTITLRVPSVDIGRVEVIPAFNPDLAQNEAGDAPGAVTLMVIPKYDIVHPDTPEPDQIFLNTICDYLDSRRLVTTELFLRGPKYKDIWVSAGIKVVAGVSIAQVREAVEQALRDFLSPLPATPDGQLDTQNAFLMTPQHADRQNGWPLLKPVVDRELMAVASRVPGVLFVKNILLAEGIRAADTQILMTGLDLPRVAGISVSVGDPVDLDQLRGQGTVTPLAPSAFKPVPVIPEECK